VVTAAVGAPRGEIDRAYAWCAKIARDHYENFPVASLLLPRRMRPAIAAVYAFARRADDFADEPGPSDSERLRLLDDWGCRLRRIAGSGANARAASSPDDLVFIALGDAIERHRLPISLFEDLLSAFRQDVLTKRYDTWADVLDYCRRSANPIGRLVLRVAGYDDRELDVQSDAICTALQLTNFWQDLKIDYGRGRIYLPLEAQARCGAREDDLAAGCMSAPWRQALREATLRTRELFDKGRPVCDVPAGRLRYELRATWLGGIRILNRIERAGFDVMSARPRLGPADAAWIAHRLFTWEPAVLRNA